MSIRPGDNNFEKTELLATHSLDPHAHAPEAEANEALMTVGLRLQRVQKGGENSKRIDL